MKKLITSTFIIASMLLTPTLRADDMEEDTGTPVGQASDEGANAARSKTWQNIGLAVGAVAIAITALILVANNDGHHHSKSGKKTNGAN